MADDKKVIFSMVKVNKETPTGKHILKDVYLSFYFGAKIGIIGVNGSGKSTVMKIIAGLDESYRGDIVWAPGYTVGYLPQEPDLDESKTVREIVEEGTQEIVDTLAEFEEINAKFMDEEILNSSEICFTSVHTSAPVEKLSKSSTPEADPCNITLPIASVTVYANPAALILCNV